SFAKPLLPRPTPPSPYEADASNLHSIPSSAWPQREAIPRTRTQAGGKGLTPQRRLRQELGVDLIHPRVELVQQGQRAPPALFASRLRVETALLARGLYVVELLEELE